MRREPHVRFRDGGEVKFLSATRSIPRHLFTEILRMIAGLGATASHIECVRRSRLSPVP